MNKIALFLLTLLIAGAPGPSFSRERDVPRRICNVNTGSCVAKTADSELEVTFDISPKPVLAMRELTFRVGLKGKKGPVPDAAVTIDLSMPGMYMGNNRVTLSAHNGVYEGTGILVRCPSGKKTWQADVVVRSAKKSSVTGFIFEVQ